MGKPNYRVVISFDRERNLHTARSPELEHLTGEGASRAEAIARLEEEIDAQLANMLSLGTTPPRAIDEIEHSGQISAKVSRGLHRELSYLARSEGVEVDQLVSELLSAALTSRQGARGGGRQRPAQHDQGDDIGNRIDSGGGNRRPFGRGNNNTQLLDDRANFIEYVRNLENGNGNHGGRHHGGHAHNNGGGHGGGHRDPNANRGGGRRGRGRGPGGPPHQGGHHHQGQGGQHQGHGQHRDNRTQGGPRGPQGGPPQQNRGPAPQGHGSDPETHEG